MFLPLLLDACLFVLEGDQQLCQAFIQCLISRVPFRLRLACHARINLCYVWHAFSCYLNSFYNRDQLIHITESVSIDVRAYQLLKGVLRLKQFEPGIAHAAHLVAVDQARKKTAAILSRVKPVNRFLSVTQVIEANRGDVRLDEVECVP